LSHINSYEYFVLLSSV